MIVDTAGSIRGRGALSSRLGRSKGRRPGRVISAAFLLAVAAFVVSTLIATAQLRDVSAQAEVISANAMPSVIALTTLRERLDELVTSLNGAVEAGRLELPSFDRTVAEIDAEAAKYEARARPLQRQEEWHHAEGLALATVSGARRAREDLVAGRIVEGRARLDAVVRPAAAAAHRALWELVELHALEAEQLAHRIDRDRRSATALLIGLDAGCVVLAIALTAAALRTVARHTELLEDRSRELELFASRVAHDVRGPLSPVALTLQRLRRDVAAEDPRAVMLDRATRALGRVTSLVDDLLAFARTGGAIGAPGRAGLLAVATSTLDEASALAESGAIELRIDPESEDVALACPPGVLTSLLSNLVHNGIKYLGGARERRVVVRAVRVGDRARVEVEDTGPGLPPGAEDDVFEPYVRADRSGQPGLGLGLATVKRLVEGYGGSVGVRSRPWGCTFWFELPVAIDRRDVAS